MGCATFEHDERRLGEDNSSAVRTASEVDQEQIKNARLSPAEHVTFLIDFSDLERITRFSLSGSDWHSSTDMAVQWFFGLTWDRGSITRYAWTVRLDGQTVNPEKPLVHGCARTRVVCVWGGGDQMVQDRQTRDSQTVRRLAKNARPCESTASFGMVLIITLPQTYDRKSQY